VDVIFWLLKQKKYDIAVEQLKIIINVLKKSDKHQGVFEAYLALVIIHLALDDYVAADRTYQEGLGIDGFPSSKESQGAAELLDAFEHGDQGKLDRVVKTQIFNIIDNQVAILARSLKITEAAIGINTTPEVLNLNDQLSDISISLQKSKEPLGKGKEKVPEDEDEELIKQKQKLFAIVAKPKKPEVREEKQEHNLEKKRGS